MRVILFCVLLRCAFGHVFTSTTREGVLPFEEKSDDDVNAYFQNIGATTAVEDNVSGAWVTPTEEVTKGNDMEMPDYDVDLINNDIDTSNNSLSSQTWSSLSEEEKELIKDIGNGTPEISEIVQRETPIVNPTEKKKPRRKISSRKGIEDKPDYKLRKGRRMKIKLRTPQLKGNWKKTCCSFGKKIGNSESTYLAENLFDECGQKTRNLSSSKITRQCKLIFLSCCENRALRRFYAERKLNSTLQN